MSDEPTEERLRKAGGAVEDFIADSGRRTMRMLDGSVLDLLNNRGSITGDHYVAGTTYYADAYAAGLCESGVIDPERVVVDGGQHKEVNDFQLDAQTRWRKATQAVGMVHSRTLVCLLLLEESLETFGRRVSKRATGKDCGIVAVTALQLALSELVNHYDRSHQSKRRTHMRGSNLPDYRPGIHPIDNSGPRDVNNSAIPTTSTRDDGLAS